MRAPVAAQVCVSLLLLPKSLSLTVLARDLDASPPLGVDRTVLTKR